MSSGRAWVGRAYTSFKYDRPADACTASRKRMGEEEKNDAEEEEAQDEVQEEDPGAGVANL